MKIRAGPIRKRPADVECRACGGAGVVETPTVLLVDHFRQVRQVVAEHLRAQRWRVLEAADVAGALQQGNGYRIDAVVWELRVPGADLAAPLAWLAQAPALTAAHRVAVALFEDDLAALPLCGEGAVSARFVKPFSLDELVATLRSLFDQRCR